MIKINSKKNVIASCILATGLIIFMLINLDLYEYKKGSPPYHMWYLAIGTISSLIIASAGIFKIQLEKKAQTAAGIIVFIISMFGSMNIAAVFCYGVPVSFKLYMINMCFYIASAAIALIISGRMYAAALTAILVSYVFNCISFIIYSFRGQPLTPTDIYGFKTAMNVASMYKFQLRYQMISATIMAIAQIMLTCKFPLQLNFRRRPIVMRAAGAMSLAGCIAIIANVNIANYDVSVFDQFHTNIIYGSAFSFYVNTSKMGLQKSDDYDPDKLNALLGKYTNEDNGAVTEDSPNLIVVMNESFADLAQIGDFETDIDYMPFFRSLKGAENTITGNLLVSPVGGNTCNTEFEFLTGMNTGLLRANAIPYAQMIFNDIPYSMASHMKGLGYRTMAFHPYHADGWNRTNVYNYMGFDEFVSYETMKKYNEKPLRMRNYVSDKGDYDTIMNYLKGKPDQSSRDFIMNVTMQNHGSYDYKAFKKLVSIEDSDGKYPLAEQYLSLIKHSDEDLEDFLSQLKEYDEPVIVLFFGDHQPNVDEAFIEQLFGKPLDEVDSETNTKRYAVPFMIWANYDIEEAEEIKTSPCYLSGLLMETAGLPKSRVHMYLDDLKKDVVQLNPFGYFDPDGIWHQHSDYDFSEYYNLEYAILKNEQLDYDF